MQNNVQNKIVRKPGRTIVLKSDQNISNDGLTGLVNSVQTSNGSQFFVFDTIQNSVEAFKILKVLNNKVRFAHYRLFFTISGLDENVNYNDLKTAHIKWITQNSSAEVLYYKQYRKDGKYLGCGDFTIDTKESMDKLLNKDECKTFNFDKYTGINYKFNKKTDQNTEQHEFS